MAFVIVYSQKTPVTAAILFEQYYPANRMNSKKKIVLASSSPYRASLLSRFGLPFASFTPAVDETPRRGETPRQLVERLARAKATAPANPYPDALVIGSDQAAVLGGEILGKPQTRARARAQLRQASGRRVDFFTGLCVFDSRSARARLAHETYSVWFRELRDGQIDGYLQKEDALDCAGGFKCEGLGIALFEKMQGHDPTTLVGLPLITLARLLREEGIDVLED